MEDSVAFAMSRGFEIGTGLLMAAIVYIVGRWVASKVSALIQRAAEFRKMEPALSKFLAQLAYYTVLAVTIISALGQLGVETTSVLALFASAGLAVGLALQGSLSNFAAGIMILLFRPFTIGDVITAGGETGGVVEIGMFATTLVNPSNHKIIVGNAAIIGGNITNYTTLGKRRTTVEFGVAYGADIHQVVAIAKKAAESCAVVIADPASPAVAFTNMNASSLDFACHSWSASADWLDCQHQVRTAIYEALNEAGIEIPFPQIVVHQNA